MKLLSRHLAEADYNEETGRLLIKFRTGGTYAYENVHPRTFNGLLAAPSKSKYFTAKIKNKHKYERVR